MKVGAKILILDEEISLDIITSYGLKEQYHAPENIIQDWYIICFSWKWLDQKKIHNFSVLDDPKRFKKNPTDDYAVVKRMHELISDADIIVGHNVDRFDWKKFMARVIFHNLPPVDKPQVVDTLKEVRKIAAFTSNKMSYLSKYLNIVQKQSHSKDMWLRIIKGDVSAIKECIKYCNGDIETTEEMYLRLRPYMQGHPNLALWRGDGIDCCSNCNSEDIVSNGTRVTKSGRYRRYQCNSCGHSMRGVHFIRRVGLP